MHDAHRRRRRHAAPAGAGLIAAALLAAPAAAQEPGDAPPPAASPQPDHAALLERLDDPDFLVRENAAAALLADTSLGPDAIADLLRRSASQEQRQRLLSIADHHIVRELREQAFGDAGGPGALGLRHLAVREIGPDGQTRTVVRVAITIPGFPAFAHLRPGDVIEAFAGQPVPEEQAANAFQEMILARRAGEQVEIRVRRGGESLTVTLRLATKTALQRMLRSADDLQLAEPFQTRWVAQRRRLEALGPQPTPLPVPAAEPQPDPEPEPGETR